MGTHLPWGGWTAPERATSHPHPNLPLTAVLPLCSRNTLQAFLYITHPQWGTRSSAGHWPALETLLRGSEGQEMLLMPLPCCFIHVTCEHETKNKPLSLAAPHTGETGLEVPCVCDKHKRKHTKIKCFVSKDPWNLWSRALCYNRHKDCFILKYEDTVFPRYFSTFFPFEDFFHAGYVSR